MSPMVLGRAGVLSPILFTVYIDDLLLGLHQLGAHVGNFWNQHFVGAPVCYADDVALLAPSPNVLLD